MGVLDHSLAFCFNGAVVVEDEGFAYYVIERKGLFEEDIDLVGPSD